MEQLLHTTELLKTLTSLWTISFYVRRFEVLHPIFLTCAFLASLQLPLCFLTNQESVSTTVRTRRTLSTLNPPLGSYITAKCFVSATSLINAWHFVRLKILVVLWNLAPMLNTTPLAVQNTLVGVGRFQSTAPTIVVRARRGSKPFTFILEMEKRVLNSPSPFLQSSTSHSLMGSSLCGATTKRASYDLRIEKAQKPVCRRWLMIKRYLRTSPFRLLTPTPAVSKMLPEMKTSLQDICKVGIIWVLFCLGKSNHSLSLTCFFFSGVLKNRVNQSTVKLVKTLKGWEWKRNPTWDPKCWALAFTLILRKVASLFYSGW